MSIYLIGVSGMRLALAFSALRGPGSGDPQRFRLCAHEEP